MLIGLKVKGLKPDRKDWIRVTPGLILGKGGEGVMWFRVCEAPLNDWANGGSVSVPRFQLMSFSRMVSMVLFLRGVGPILGNGYGI